MIHAESQFAKAAQHPGFGRAGYSFVRIALILASLLASFFAFAVSPAEAAYIHTTVTGEYGKEGPKSTGIGSGCHIGYQSATQRLYLSSDNKIYGLQRTGPGSVTQLAGFPVEAVDSTCGFPDFEVDNSPGASKGNLYAVINSGGAIYGWNSAGTPLPAPYPINGEQNHDGACGVAATNDGEVWEGFYGAQTVQKFSTAGAALGSIFIGVYFCKFAVDPTNKDLYIQPYGSGIGVIKYTAASGYTSKTTFPSVGHSNSAIVVNGAQDRLYVGSGTQVRSYNTETGDLYETINLGGQDGQGMALDEPTDTLFVAVGSGGSGVIKELPGIPVPDVTTGGPTNIDHTSVTVTGDVALGDGSEVIGCYFEYVTESAFQATGFTNLASGGSKACSPAATPASPFTGPTDVTADLSGLTTQTTYRYRLVASNAGGTSAGGIRTVTPPAVLLTTEPATDTKTTSATLNGTVNPEGLETTYYFQYGKSTNYSDVTATPPGVPLGTTATDYVPVSFNLEDLEPGVTYHFRLVASNSSGTSFGDNQTFATPAPPAIEGVLSENVTETSADLTATINPNGYDTEYYFEYGKTPEYGAVLPAPSGTLPPETAGQEVTVPLTGLEGVTYHFRLIAKSQWGTVVSENQTFGFNPPRGCPNHSIRQQSGSAYLPDCRAYELVSPARSGGAMLRPFGPSSPYAHNHFAFTGLGNVIPDTGEPPNGDLFGDLYVASRTASGWTTRYVGMPGYQSLAQGGPHYAGYHRISSIYADSTLERFLVWDYGQLSFIYGHLAEYGGSSAPYMFDSDGRLVQRLPTNLQQIPGGEADILQGGFVGTARPSADMSHYVFSSRELAFADGGTTSPPGSVYDNDLTTGTVTTASWTAAMEPIAQDPRAAAPAEFMQIPAVSKDGSHILMSTTAREGLVHLYMRVNGAVTYEISTGVVPRIENDGVKFEGMSPDGSTVYFTSRERLTEDDHDTSVDLFRWTEHNDTLTRLTAATNGSGDTDGCKASWKTRCDVEVVPTNTRVAAGQAAPPVDSPFAADSGDIYFYSPELLDGVRGTVNQRNLYVWRNGAVKHVATLEPSMGAERINVSPDGAFMGFITTTQVTSYDNARFAQMYLYRPATRTIICVSCVPDGSPPSGDVMGSQNGRFMTDDGRAFFTTGDTLVPRDANRGIDVYEYVEGRPQLISSGTGEEYYVFEGERELAGLIGVSADGVNAFFATTETLVNDDENGPRYKFYVARTNGGFPFNKPPAPCAAADECHGDSSTPPRRPEIGTSADLGSGGNAASPKRKSCRPKAKLRARKAKPRAKKCQRKGHRRPEKKGHRSGRKVTR